MIPFLALVRNAHPKPYLRAYITGVIVMIIIISSLGLFDYTITGLASSTASARSNVTIAAAISIALSDNLSADGISFGIINVLPANQTNATGNYNNATYGNDRNFTQYNVTLSSDSTQNADFCIRANTDLATSGGTNRIGLANMTWAANTTNNRTHPPAGDFRANFGRSMTTSFDKGDVNLAPGGATNYRFWLNVSGGQAAGDYNNTADFRGVTTGDACGS